MKTSIKNLFPLPALITGLVLILTSRMSAQTFTTLHSFTGGSDGGNLNAGLTLSGDTLYGAADSGGSGDSGTVYSLNTNGTAFTTLYSFTAGSGSDPDLINSDGNQPFAALVISGNTLYGTAFYGGANGRGTIFAVNTNGAGSFTNLYTFSAGNNIPPFGYFTNRAVNRDGTIPYTNSDGGNPQAGLILSGNTLYGAASYGGVSANGTVFALNTAGTGFTNLHSFTIGGNNSSNTYTNSDGADPHGVLLLSGNSLYGTTIFGGTSGNGTVFKVNTNGTGFTNLHSFAAGTGSFPKVINSSGANPAGGLLLSGNRLYGTAYDGGSSGYGTVFALNTDGTGFTNLYTFTATDSAGNNSDGANPIAGLIISGNTLYGTASNGGSAGSGTVFAFNTNGAGYTTLYAFTPTDPDGYNSDGANPYAGLLLSGTTLYGTAKSGGSSGDGTVFSISLAFAVTTTSLPNGTNGVPYNETLEAFGGQIPYSWTNSPGALPPGLTLATNGVISGTPTTNGTFNFTVKVTDALSATATQALALTVIGLPSVVWIQPTNGSITVPVGSNVTFPVLVTGTGPFSYQWQLNGTNLSNGIITTVAGNGTQGYSGDGGAATNGEFYYPSGVAVDAVGNLFIADYRNNRIRKVGTNGIITTVAGGGTNGLGDGGAATNAGLYPYGVAVDAAGNVFIADEGNQRIRKVGTNGIITTVAGNGTHGFSGDGGAATNGEFYYPYGVAVDAVGNLFIADNWNNRIRKVGTNGIITTVAGNGYFAGTGFGGYSGDGGVATNAELYVPEGVAVDAAGNLFIADFYNNRIRKVGTNGIITTVVGNGTGNYSGDGGAATNAGLFSPGGVVVDAIGNLFIADSWNSCIRKVGTNGIISTVAGNGTYGFSGDGGTATNAELSWPSDVAVDATGNLFIADIYNERIRKVVFPGPILVLNGVGFGNAGAYDVVVSGPFGSVTSSVVNLTVTLRVVLAAPQVAVGKTNFTFLVSGPAGSNYVLQVSTNLSNWSSVSTSAIPVSGTITLSNAISGYNRRFYRAYLQ